MSAEELVDVVNQDDRLIGKTITLREAHAQHLAHRVAAILVFKPSGKMLVQVHKSHGRRLDHAVGGHVSAGEDYEAAAKREMQEELLLEAPLTQIAEGVISDEHYPQNNLHILHMFGVFTAQVPENWQLSETEEVDQVLEMRPEDILSQMRENPDKFLQGFMTSFGAFLIKTGSTQKIQAYGKNWGEL